MDDNWVLGLLEWTKYVYDNITDVCEKYILLKQTTEEVERLAGDEVYSKYLADSEAETQRLLEASYDDCELQNLAEFEEEESYELACEKAEQWSGDIRDVSKEYNQRLFLERW